MRLLLLIGILLAALAFAFLGSDPDRTELPGQTHTPTVDAGDDSETADLVGDPGLLSDDDDSGDARISVPVGDRGEVFDYYGRTADMFSTDKMLVATVVRDETGEPIPGARFAVYAPAYHERGVVADENGMFTLPIPDVAEYRDEHAPLSTFEYSTENWSFHLQSGALGERLVQSVFTVERGDDNEPVVITLRVSSVDKVVTIRVVSPGSEPLETEVFFQAIGHFMVTKSTVPHGAQEEPVIFGGPPTIDESNEASQPTEDSVAFDFEAHQGDRGFRIWAETEEGFVAPPMEFEPETLPDLVHVQLVKCARLHVTVLTHGGEAVRDIRVESIPDSSMRGLTQTLGRSTNASGRATFDNLLPIRVNVNVFLRKGGLHTVRGIDLQPGEDRELEIRLQDEGPIAISGRVIDENDKPLRNQPIAIDFGTGTASAMTNALGEFTFHSDAEGPFAVSANRDVSSDTFEPPLVHAQHGTRNLEFQRTARVSLREFRIEVFHALTLESLGEVATIIDRGPGTEAWSETRSPRSTFTERVDAHTRLRIELEGFQPYATLVQSALAAGESGAPLIVVLEPVD